MGYGRGGLQSGVHGSVDIRDGTAHLHAGSGFQTIPFYRLNADIGSLGCGIQSDETGAFAVQLDSGGNVNSKEAGR